MNEPHESEQEKIVAPAVHFYDGRPYVHQLPVDERVKEFINSKYRFNVGS